MYFILVILIVRCTIDILFYIKLWLTLHRLNFKPNKLMSKIEIFYLVCFVAVILAKRFFTSKKNKLRLRISDGVTQ